MSVLIRVFLESFQMEIGLKSHRKTSGGVGTDLHKRKQTEEEPDEESKCGTLFLSTDFLLKHKMHLEMGPHRVRP